MNILCRLRGHEEFSHPRLGIKPFCYTREQKMDKKAMRNL